MADVYDALRKRLDDMATGFPETESKVEIAFPSAPMRIMQEREKI